MRLAGFHHSRADTLELWSDEITKDYSAEDLGKLADLLAADKVAFGKTAVDWGAGKISIEQLTR